MASRRLWLVAASMMVCFSAWGANVHPDLAEVKKVYLLPMTSGLDQYLANRLTQVGRFEVVTDPAVADAVFTDRLGPAFEDKWVELYPPPPPPDEENKSKEAKAAPGPRNMMEDLPTGPVNRISSFSRGRGNIFLVSRKDRAVLWSHFKPAKNTRVKELDSVADDIADQLHRDLKVKK
ncbi:MAG TPA: hypothetical protein VER03_23220 [Bryobacteraceae bacterium]|nr:hypothetical protein [Bryobacteraceae bacterium]